MALRQEKRRYQDTDIAFFDQNMMVAGPRYGLKSRNT